ncbi:putative anaphase promoting complex subunit 11 [Phaeosphaeria sp. MPI-PUGE-AT-0046c]|nr:putative anaphase promoting complex subunit 11 [Phaeosphaeria sp. MPI-PUGE-AT-0046c]
MKVTIREWNAVAAWRWDMPDDDVCGICRNPYDSTCSKCKFPGDECPLRESRYKMNIVACVDIIQYSANATTLSTWYGTFQKPPVYPTNKNSALHLFMAQAGELS